MRRLFVIAILALVAEAARAGEFPLPGARAGRRIASRARSLLANGANCSAGQSPLGVDTSGAAESCFTVSTPSSTDNPVTNKTLDAEGTGNLVTLSVKMYIPGGACVNTTAASNWDTHATDPVAACVAGTIINKGVLTFDDTNTCTSTTATIGCAQQTLELPSDWSGNVDVKLLYTSATTTNAQTEKWTIATKCTTPTGGSGVTDNPSAWNTAQTVTYTLGASEVASALRNISQSTITMTGCVAGDLFHIRIGRDISDTDTASMNLVGVEITWRRAI